MNLLWLLVILVLLFAVTGAPSLGMWNHGYGWYPSGLGLIVVIVLVVLLLRNR